MKDTEITPPGRRLDALVAEKVMGWLWVTEDAEQPEAVPYLRDGKGGVYYPTVAAEFPKLPTAGGNIPPYSTDIGAAWEVLEKMRAQLPGKEIMLYHLDGWGVGSLCQAPSTIEIGEHYGEAETAPHAICLAALQRTRRGDLVTFPRD